MKRIMLRNAFPICGFLFLIAGCAKSQAEDAVKRQLDDPNSAQFSNVSSKGNVVCGLVNSKNGGGGYDGSVGFIVQNGIVVKILPASAIFPSKEFSELCPDDSINAVMAAHVDRYNREAAERRGY